MKATMRPGAIAIALVAACMAQAAAAQNYPITGAQRATAQQVAQAGVPLSELSPNAPDRYTVQRGDTLWDISGLYLVRPWRWPELWGMNLQTIRNPHLIYPGQVLVLEKRDGRAFLRAEGAPDGSPVPTVRLSPRVRSQPLGDTALPTLKPHLIEPFLAEPLVVDEETLARAPRLVAATEGRVLITRGDRAYARGPSGQPLAEPATGPLPAFRVFRSTRALVDPVTGAVLGQEAQYLGRAVLARGEGSQTTRTEGRDAQTLPVPATLDIVAAREEMRTGDRLLPEPPTQLVNYTPRAPEKPIEGGAIVSMYGSSVGMAGQNQVVAINKGAADGMVSGHVLAILKRGGQVTDRTEGRKETLQLPDERNGLLMVFRTFEKVSYALILQTSDGVRVGDRLANPR
ncbi:LysM peptidoglycan-binding domain-containing protein [Ramlibacter sp. MAHUQ-53]|uniref:LysM peptidoglycan-binding domain-containing protein n=1 Tax=unclassified Ramlibacter TaxID=2617605 RepID=UPI0036314CD9